MTTSTIRVMMPIIMIMAIAIGIAWGQMRHAKTSAIRITIVSSSISPANQGRIRRPAPFNDSAIVQDVLHPAIYIFFLAFAHGLSCPALSVILVRFITMMQSVAGCFESLALMYIH